MHIAALRLMWVVVILAWSLAPASLARQTEPPAKPEAPPPRDTAPPGVPKPESEDAAPVVTVTLLEAGAQPHQLLRYKVKKGDTFSAELLTKMNAQVELGPQSLPQPKLPAMRIVVQAIVEQVQQGGDITCAVKYLEADAVDEPGLNPMIMGSVRQSLKSMAGLVGRAVLTDRGMVKSAKFETPADAGPIARQQIKGMEKNFGQMVPLPTEPVGPGARWEVKTLLTQEGMKMDQLVTVTLDSIEGSELHMSATIAQSAGPQSINTPNGPPMDLKSLSGQGAGTSVILLSSLLPKSATAQMKTQLEGMVKFGPNPQPIKQVIELQTTTTQPPPAKPQSATPAPPATPPPTPPATPPPTPPATPPPAPKPQVPPPPPGPPS